MDKSVRTSSGLAILLLVVLLFRPLEFISGSTNYVLVSSVGTKVEMDYLQVAQIESAQRDSVVSTEGAIGRMQIMPIVLKDWNRTHLTQYKKSDLFNSEINVRIGKWLLSEQIPYYFKKNNIPEKMNHRLIAYNWGIGNFLTWYKKGQNYEKLPDETKQYLIKYWNKY